MWPLLVPYSVRRNLLNYYIAPVMTLLAGLAIGFAIPALSDQSLYRLIMLALGGAIGFGIMISGNAERILMVCLAFSVPLNLAFSPLGSVPSHIGGARLGIIVYLYDLPLFALLGYWVLEIFLKRGTIYITKIDLAAFLFIIWAGLSFRATTDGTATFYELVRIVKTYLLVHLISTNVKSPGIVRDVILGITGAILLQAAISVLQYFINFDVGGLGFTVGTTNRVSGTVGWPNTFGAYMASSLSILLGLWVCRATGKWEWLLLIVVAIGVIPIVISFSRGAWLALGLSVAGIYAFAFYGKLLTQRSILTLILILALAGFAYLFFSTEINQRNQEDTVSVRLRLNEVAYNMIEANPVSGIGLNTFVRQMRYYDSSGVSHDFPYPVHNYFLLVASETGIVGLALFILICLTVFYTGLRILRKADRFLGAVTVGLLGGFGAILVTNISDVQLSFDVMMVQFWLFIGLILAVRRMVEER